VFASYKHRLQTVCQGAIVDSATGKLSLEVLLQCVCQCIVEILECRSWANACADSGLTGTQTDVSARVLSKLTCEQIPEVGSDLPTLAQLMDVFPKRAVLPIDNMLVMFLTPSSAGGPHRMPHAVITVAPAIPDDMQPGPITRSRAASRTTLLATLSPEPSLGPRLMPVRPAATDAAVAALGSAAPASSGSSGSAGFAALLADVPGAVGGEQLGESIARLRHEQDAVRANRKRVTKELKNAQKRKQRLKKRAKQLSDTELV
jgi:hypothetical protein